MVERRPILGVLAHVILVLGVLVVALPLYITFVASTHTAQEVVQAPMPMLPGSHFIDNYTTALVGGGSGAGSHASVSRMMFVSLVTALLIAFGKIAISLLSAFAIVYFHFIDNYTTALVGGGSGAGSHASVGRMMFVSLVTALLIAFGKIAISLLSAFAIVQNGRFRAALRGALGERSKRRGAQ